MMVRKMRGCMASLVTIMAVMSFCSYLAFAADPSPLQDFCVAVDNSNIFDNGKLCKNPNHVTSDDFFSTGLRKRANTNNHAGAAVTLINVDVMPGLNTLGISMSSIDFDEGGQNQPHIHPRATELLTVVKGKVMVSFITTNGPRGNQFFTKVLGVGDLFVVPPGLVHFERNVGRGEARAIVAFNSQNGGTLTIAAAMFGSKPEIPIDALTKAFQVGPKVINQLKAQFH